MKHDPTPSKKNMEKGAGRPKKKLKVDIPPKPVLRFKDNGTVEEQNEIETRYLEEMKAYREKVVAFVKQKGVHGVSMNKIRIFFDSEFIFSQGGRRILEYRWNRYVQGNPMLRVPQYRYRRPLPTYTLLERQPCGVFDTSDVRCVPMDVLATHMFPYLDCAALHYLMLTCRQFQAYAHHELFCRAQRKFGPTGTPMALYATYIGLDTFVHYTLPGYGCLDNYATLQAYDLEQSALRTQDDAMLRKFMSEDYHFVRNVVVNTLGKNFDILFYNYNAMAKCSFVNITFIRVYDSVYNKRSKQLISLITKAVNAGRRDTDQLSALLQKYKPDSQVHELICMFAQNEVYNYICHSLNFIFLGPCIRAMVQEMDHRGGMQWVRALFRNESYKSLCRNQVSSAAFIFDQHGEMTLLDTEREQDLIEAHVSNGYVCIDQSYYTKR